MSFDGRDGYVAGLESLARIFEPKRALSVSQWASRYRKLTSKSASEPGPWRNERIPYLPAIMDALSTRHPAPLVVFAKSSQVGGSECGLNWIGSTVMQSPASFLALFPTDRQARQWVRTRLDSMIATTPPLRHLLPLGRKENAGNTLSEKHYPGGVLFTGSANIADDLAAKSVPNLLFDDADRMPVVLSEEGDPIELALRRSANFPRAKAFIISTPTTAENSRIWPAWLSSTMDRYYVPCAHCGHMQYLRWQQLKWVAGKSSTAGYACEECDALHEERHKTDMLACGEWRATHPEREHEVKGFHVNGLYTPIGLGDSWAKHAAAWERAQGSQARIQVFFNTRLGEVHKGERQRVDWELVHRRGEPYRLREIPRGVLLLTSGTDVQKDRLETQILGHGRGERVVVLDYVVHYGDTTRTTTSGDGQASVWQALDEYLARTFDNAFGVRMQLSCSLIDSGYLPDVVLGFTRTRKARGIYASRGSTIATKQPIGRPSFPDVKRRGRQDFRHGVERYELGVSVLKHWLFELLRADEGDDEKPVHIADRHIRFSSELPVEYFRQLTAEVYDPKHGWVERANYHRNEALDTFVLARAAAMHHTVNLHRLRDVDFERLESLFEPTDTTTTQQAKPAKLGTDAIDVVGGFLPTSARTH
jgi:phage terminase large subunit GpA-like protein